MDNKRVLAYTCAEPVNDHHSYTMTTTITRTITIAYSMLRKIRK